MKLVFYKMKGCDTMKCSKCNKEFTEAPALSRRDNTEICPLCGSKEALEDAVGAGLITKKLADIILEKLETDSC